MLHNILFVAMGGTIGAMLRYLLSKMIQGCVVSVFPLATFFINVLGCLLIGVLYGLFAKGILISSDLKLLLITGLCGGFTTFSTFSSESVTLLLQGYLFTFFLYIGGSLFIGMLFVYLGIKIVS